MQLLRLPCCLFLVCYCFTGVCRSDLLFISSFVFSPYCYSSRQLHFNPNYRQLTFHSIFLPLRASHRLCCRVLFAGSSTALLQIPTSSSRSPPLLPAAAAATAALRRTPPPRPPPPTNAAAVAAVARPSSPSHASAPAPMAPWASEPRG